MRRVSFIVILGLSLLTVGTLAGCRGKPNKKPPPAKTKSVEIMVVKSTDLERIITAQGKAQAWQEAKLAAEVAGVIKRFYVDRGDPISVGNPLVALVDDNYKRRVKERKAQLVKAKALLALAIKKHRRHRKLLRSRVLAKSSHDETQAGYLSASADVRLAQVALDQAEYDLRKTTIITPLTGVVVARYREPGEMITAGTVLLHVANYRKIKIEIGLTEWQVVQIKKGQAAVVTFDVLPGKTFAARIDVVGVSADADAGTFPVRVAVENPDRIIRPGMIARISMKGLTIKNILLVPAEAVIEQFGQAYVYRVVGKKAVRTTVKLGPSHGERRRILGGLKPGDKLVIIGQSQLRPDIPIKIVKVHR